MIIRRSTKCTREREKFHFFLLLLCFALVLRVRENESKTMNMASWRIWVKRHWIFSFFLGWTRRLRLLVLLQLNSFVLVVGCRRYFVTLPNMFRYGVLCGKSMAGKQSECLRINATLHNTVAHSTGWILLFQRFILYRMHFEKFSCLLDVNVPSMSFK